MFITKGKNYTLSIVGIASASVSLSKNQISPFVTSKVSQRVLLGTDIVPILS